MKSFLDISHRLQEEGLLTEIQIKEVSDDRIYIELDSKYAIEATEDYVELYKNSTNSLKSASLHTHQDMVSSEEDDFYEVTYEIIKKYIEGKEHIFHNNRKLCLTVAGILIVLALIGIGISKIVR